MSMTGPCPDWPAAFLAHFNKALGPTAGREIFRYSSEVPPMHVIRLERGMLGGAIYASLGLSLYGAAVGGRAEVFMVIAGPAGDAPFILANSLFYMAQERMKLDSEATIRFADIFPEFAARWGKTSLYFTAPWGAPQDFDVVTCGDESGRVRFACFINDEEDAFFATNGAETFEAMLFAQAEELARLDRPPCV